MGGKECHAEGSCRDYLFDFGSLVEVGDPHREYCVLECEVGVGEDDVKGSVWRGM